MTKIRLCVAGIATLGALALAEPAVAAEGGTSFYLLGSKTTMAGFLPGPGFYASLQNYGYSGSGNIAYESGGVTVSGNVKATAYVALPTVLWVLNQDVLGGNLAFTLTTPYGGKSLNADALLTGPGGGVISTNFQKDNWDFGDPVVGATWGGKDGDLHYTLNALVNVPIGPWEKGNPINISFHRWAVDTTAALTYLDPKTGVELSGAAGFTFNGENPDTNYRTGTEFHLEAAAMLHVSRQLSFGLNGYMYDQISGDSGSGAVLGGFEGRVYAIGPALDFTFLVGKTPVVTSFRYFHEFGAKNRLEGDAGFINLAVPLGGQTAHE
jgi:hypothetical protein